MAEADGVFFLTLAKGDRMSIATTVQRLIDMLDDLEPDPDLEPSLGARERHGEGSQEYWAAGAATGVFDECEDVSEDEGAPNGDDEFTLGWSEVGSLRGDLSSGSYGHMDGESEPSIGWTEGVDQVRRLECASCWVDDTEPDLGWAETHGKGIVGAQNCLDDREASDVVDEPHDWNELDDDVIGDADGDMPGAGSVSQFADGWRPAPGSAVAPSMVEKARRMPDGNVVREIARFCRFEEVPLLKASAYGRVPWA